MLTGRRADPQSRPAHPPPNLITTMKSARTHLTRPSAFATALTDVAFIRGAIMPFLGVWDQRNLSLVNSYTRDACIDMDFQTLVRSHLLLACICRVCCKLIRTHADPWPPIDKFACESTLTTYFRGESKLTRVNMRFDTKSVRVEFGRFNQVVYTFYCMRYPTHLEDQDIDTIVAGLDKLRGDMGDFNRSMERWHLGVNVPLLYNAHTEKTWVHFASTVERRINVLGGEKIEEHIFLTYFDDIEKLRGRISKRLHHCNERELIEDIGRDLDDAPWAVTPGGVAILPCGTKLMETYVHDSHAFKVLKATIDPRQMHRMVWLAMNSYGMATVHIASAIQDVDNMLDFCKQCFTNYVN